MKKKSLTWILCLSMVLALFAGCGQTEQPTVSSTEPVSSVAEEPAVPSPSAAPTVEGSAEDALPADSVVEEPVEEISEEINFVQFPFTEEPTTLTVWTRAPAGNPVVLPGTYSEFEIFQQLEEKSNVHIDWKESTNEGAATQFNLMCASGDYTDIITGVNGNYSGGLSKAYEDGIIDDMRDYMNEYAPNYTALMDANETIYRECVSDDGSFLAFYTINDEPDMAAGLFIRQDWLDALGLDMPETYDQLADVLSAMKNAYDCDYSLLLTESCVVGDSGDLTAGFGVAGFNVKELNRYHMFISEDGKVTSCLIEDGYRDYLAYLNGLYQEGLIGQDFFTISCDPFAGTSDQLIVNSQSAVFKLNTRGIDNILSTAVDESFAVSPLPNIGKEAGLINHFSDASLVNTNASASISTTCANPEAAVMWMDYWYSDEGMLIKNYGVEGISFEYVNGEPEFTDAVVNNEWGVSPDTAITHYNIQNQLVGRSMTNLTWDYYTELQKTAKDLWKSTADSQQVLPGTLTLTTDESEEYASYFGDISTYVATMIPKFITGDESLDDWDAYIATLEDMGIGNCLDAYQQAYDRYLQR